MHTPQTHLAPRISHLLPISTEIQAVKESKMEPGHPVVDGTNTDRHAAQRKKVLNEQHIELRMCIEKKQYICKTKYNVVPTKIFPIHFTMGIFLPHLVRRFDYDCNLDVATKVIRQKEVSLTLQFQKVLPTLLYLQMYLIQNTHPTVLNIVKCLWIYSIEENVISRHEWR